MNNFRAASRNPDLWLAGCPEFSRPICAQLREWIMRWELDLAESIRWNSLCYTGRKAVCALSGYKKHAGIAFFRGTELDDVSGVFIPAENNTWMRSIRVTKLETFNREAFRKLLRAAVRLDENPDILPPPPQRRGPLVLPGFFAESLRKNKAAAEGFAGLAPTYQREYVVWLTTAKREETKAKRLTETLAALAAKRKWMDRKRD